MAREGLGVAQHTYTTHWDTLTPLLRGTATWSLSTPTFGTTFGEIGGVGCEGVTGVCEGGCLEGRGEEGRGTRVLAGISKLVGGLGTHWGAIIRS